MSLEGPFQPKPLCDPVISVSITGLVENLFGLSPLRALKQHVQRWEPFCAASLSKSPKPNASALSVRYLFHRHQNNSQAEVTSNPPELQSFSHSRATSSLSQENGTWPGLSSDMTDMWPRSLQILINRYDFDSPWRLETRSAQTELH